MTMDSIIEKLNSERADLAAGLEKIDAALAALTAGASAESAPVAEEAPRKRGRRKMTAAQKRAISERMKKSWAARKAKA